MHLVGMLEAIDIRMCLKMRRLTLGGFWIILIALFQIFASPYGIAKELDKAPEFELDDMRGQHHRLSDYRGKIVLINFWASWCPECIEEMPSLNKLYEKYQGKGLVVLGISADRKKEAALKLLTQTQVTYPVLLDTSGGVFIKRYTVIALPTTVVIDRNGLIVERIIGRIDFSSAAFVKKIIDLM
jgi:peroxiredoxin